MRHPIRVWLDDAWARTRLVQVLAGGEGDGPLSGRRVLGRIESPDALAELRVVTSDGSFSGDICRCPGGLTLSLHDADGEFVGRGTLHGGGAVAWERARFRDNLEIADPLGLALLLAEHGASHRLVHFVPQLADAMGLREDRTRARKAGHGRGGAVRLTRRQVPASLRSALVKLSEAEVDGLRERLADEYPDPAGRSVALLRWLGSLPEPAGAESDEGALVRRLLEGLDPVRGAAALARPPDGAVTLGLLRWGRYQPGDPDIADLVGPGMRALLG